MLLLTLALLCFTRETYCDVVDFDDEKTQEAYQTAIDKLLTDALIGVVFHRDNDVSGSIDPLGTFSTHSDTMEEYFYGPTWTGVARVTKVFFEKLSSEKNIVYGKVVLTFEMYDKTQENVILTYNTTQGRTFTFGRSNRIRSSH